DRPFIRSALGLDVCLSLTTRVHRVRFSCRGARPEGRGCRWLVTIDRQPDSAGFNRALSRVLGQGVCLPERPKGRFINTLRQRSYSVLIFSSLSRLAFMDSSTELFPLIHAPPSRNMDW